MVQQGYQKISKANRKPRAAANATISSIKICAHVNQQLSE